MNPCAALCQLFWGKPVSEIKFEVKQVLFEEEKDETNCFRVTIINWGKGGDKLDFRNWYKGDDDQWKPGKGAGVDPNLLDPIARALSGAPPEDE